MKFLTCLLLFVSLYTHAQETETISWDDATINSKLTLTINKQEFDRIYKKADSIVTPKYEDICGADADSNFQYIYYKGLQYEMDNRIMNFRQLQLSKKTGMFFTYKGKRYDHTSKPEDFKVLFPNATAAISESDDKAYKIIKLLPAEAGEDSEWLFYFKNGYLILIECKFPC